MRDRKAYDKKVETYVTKYADAEAAGVQDGEDEPMSRKGKGNGARPSNGNGEAAPSNGHSNGAGGAAGAANGAGGQNGKGEEDDDDDDDNMSDMGELSDIDDDDDEFMGDMDD